MDIKVLIASHREYKMPSDPMYVPVFVGAALHDADIKGFERDDSGDNISLKNPYYCELTALYWGWKNLDCDYMGLVHYRRHFMKEPCRFSWEKILDREDAENIFRSGIDVILPGKRHYIIETLYSHYKHSHHPEDLQTAEYVISRDFPEYREDFLNVMKSRSAHMFNMCIMKKEILDQYCRWLFEVLEKIEEQLDISSYSDFDKRVFGRISELLMDVWIRKNKIKYAELSVRNTEGEHLASKAANVVKRKLLYR
ncbi:MAG: DUF4422 domain-containing protein [Parasporobacterium sp.]|nr:DUF4422 domain-containing protein [Parasporobacterium sp.]